MREKKDKENRTDKEMLIRNEVMGSRNASFFII